MHERREEGEADEGVEEGVEGGRIRAWG